MHAGFYWGNITERDRFEILGVDGRIKLKWVLKNVDWINRAQDTNNLFVVVNTVIDLHATTRGKFVDRVTINLSGMTQAVRSYLPSESQA